MDYNAIINGVLNDGGFTIGTHKRFVVSLTHNALSGLTIDGLRNGLKELNGLAKKLNLSSFCFGVWVDSETETAFLDLNLSFHGKKEALKFGAIFNQLAIFDAFNFEEIRLNNEGLK